MNAGAEISRVVEPTIVPRAAWAAAVLTWWLLCTSQDYLIAARPSGVSFHETSLCQWMRPNVHPGDDHDEGDRGTGAGTRGDRTGPREQGTTVGQASALDSLEPFLTAAATLDD